MKSLIFVVDDQPGVCELARKCLEADDYAVLTFSDSSGEAGSEGAERPSLMILKMGLLQGSGWPNRWLKPQFDGIPRLVLLDNGSAKQTRRAIDSGAADYLVKPFSPHELLARVQAVLLRSTPSNSPGRSREADIVIDSWAMRLVVRGIEVQTTTLEFRLLEYMARHRGQVFTRDFLLDAVWGDMRFINPRSVDACIRRIREKIEPLRERPTILKTVRGVGYCLDAKPTWQSAPREVCDCSACKAKVSALRWREGSTRLRPSGDASSAS